MEGWVDDVKKQANKLYIKNPLRDFGQIFHCCS